MKTFENLLQQLEDQDLDFILVICPTQDLANSLFEYFAHNDVDWTGITSEVRRNRTMWSEHKDLTAYVVRLRKAKAINESTFKLTMLDTSHIRLSVLLSTERNAILHALAVIHD